MLGIWMEWWGDPAPMKLKLLGLALWAGSSALFFLFGRTLCDVWLEADHLLISRGGRPEKVRLEEISGFSETRAQKIKTVKIKLRPGSVLGSEIRFVPALGFQAPFSEHPVIREIEERKRALAGNRIRKGVDPPMG
jgi:hypothetical protein